MNNGITNGESPAPAASKSRRYVRRAQVWCAVLFLGAVLLTLAGEFYFLPSVGYLLMAITIVIFALLWAGVALALLITTGIFCSRSKRWKALWVSAAYLLAGTGLAPWLSQEIIARSPGFWHRRQRYEEAAQKAVRGEFEAIYDGRYLKLASPYDRLAAGGLARRILPDQTSVVIFPVDAFGPDFRGYAYSADGSPPFGASYDGSQCWPIRGAEPHWWWCEVY